MRLWDLPGPVRFVEAVERSLRNGVNVVARFPGAMPNGFCDSVMAKLDHVLVMNRFSAGDSPFESLCNQYAPGSSISPWQNLDFSGLCSFRTLALRWPNDGFQERKTANRAGTTPRNAPKGDSWLSSAPLGPK